MATDPPLLTRRRAIAILRADRERIVALYDPLPPAVQVTPGLGGGAWSPADLLGHLESWEEHALAALDAWARDEPAPIDAAFRTSSTSAINAAEVARKAGRTGAQARRHAARTHERLLARIAALTDAQWRSPATSRAHKPLGHRVGQILVGRRDPFRHDEAHLRDLRAFVAHHGHTG
ncbi:MAG TPA: DinB family protein [Actinomycetota bacterium]